MRYNLNDCPCCVLLKYIFYLNVCRGLVCYVFCVVLCVFLGMGHFVTVPFNMTCLHCLQHSFFEHLFNLYYQIAIRELLKPILLLDLLGNFKYFGQRECYTSALVGCLFLCGVVIYIASILKLCKSIGYGKGRKHIYTHSKQIFRLI